DVTFTGGRGVVQSALIDRGGFGRHQFLGGRGRTLGAARADMDGVSRQGQAAGQAATLITRTTEDGDGQLVEVKGLWAALFTHEGDLVRRPSAKKPQVRVSVPFPPRPVRPRPRCVPPRCSTHERRWPRRGRGPYVACWGTPHRVRPCCA